MIENQAPAFLQSLKRSFPPEVAASITSRFRESIESFGADYPELYREKGVSFNPLQARLWSLLSQMGGVRSEKWCLACAELPMFDYGKLNDPMSETKNALRALSECSLEHREALPLAGVYLLDQLRHAHLRPVPEKALTFAEFLKEIGEREGQTIPHRLLLSIKKSYMRIDGADTREQKALHSST